MTIALLLLPDFLLIAAGAPLKRVRGFDAAFWSGVERLVYFVLFPALLFRSLATSPLALADAGRLAAVGLAFTLAGMLLAALAQPLFRLPHATFAACFQCGFRFNTYIALAVASRVGGEPALAAISLLVGVLVPVVNLAAVGMLARGRESRIASSSRAIRWCSPARPASRGRRRRCRCPRSRRTFSGCSPAPRCRLGCLPSAPDSRSARRRCRCGDCVVERRQARRAAGGGIRGTRISPGCRRWSGRSRS